ncbi:MAG: class I SAM-dependent methyltransferase [Firmicutes bacterium]|nr:class I SAM-dependent methyltransferase [Bacillota bacterium]
MKKNQVSLTALGTTYMRAYHAMHDVPKIFNDFLAYSILTEEERIALEKQYTPSVQFIKTIDPISAASCHNDASALAWSMRAGPGTSHTLSRSRYTEDKLEEAVKHGVKQYVILGAGMDTFAFRRPELVEQLQVFEVDHPATQAFKRNRLIELGWEKTSQLHFIPVDFTQDSLSTALAQSSYNQQAKSFFSWLGVTMYLTRDEVFATLRAIANVAPAGSAVIFDYMDTDAFDPERVNKRMQLAMELVQQMGEPLITGFNPLTLDADLRRLDICLHENLSPSDIEEHYFQERKDGYHACEHVHFAWAIVK